MSIVNIDGFKLKLMLERATNTLEANKEEVNALNVFPVPDGDTGTNMLLTMNSALKQVMNVNENSTTKIANAASQGSLMGARGNSGVILSQLFRGLANGIGGNESIDVKILAQALNKAAETAYKAVMKPTEGTILTVARECGEKAMAICESNDDLSTFLKDVIDHGKEVLNKTPEMLPVLKQAGVVDAGGKGYLYILEGAYLALIDDKTELKLRTESMPAVIQKSQNKVREHIDTDDIKFGYCTEFMVNTPYTQIDEFRSELANCGDSLLVVGGEGLIKVHLHTNNPGEVLEKALTLGELSDIKIDNMRFQHEEILLKDELKKEYPKNSNEDTQNFKPYSIIAISVGSGIDKLFKDLHVDQIVSGGQTMNPSTEDILLAIENTIGENVIILPNNSNIILAAEQAKNLSDRNITVIPTKTIPQGIAAILALDLEADLEYNKENMLSAVEAVTTGQITFAVRDTNFNGTSIEKGDIIGLSEKEILASGKDIKSVSLNLLEKLVTDETSIITTIFGEDISKKDAEDLVFKLNEIYPDIDIELLEGGQPLYYYIFAIE